MHQSDDTDWPDCPRTIEVAAESVVYRSASHSGLKTAVLPSWYASAVRGVTAVRVLTLVVAMSMFVVFAGTPGNAQPCSNSSTGKYVVCFNDPNADRERLFTHLVGLINSTQHGDEIRFAMYQLTNGLGMAVVDALVRAAGRGVYVRAVLYHDPPVPPSSGAAAHLAAHINHVEWCTRSCIEQTPGSIQHNKFFLVERGAGRIVMQTSTNLTDDQLANYNDSVEIHGDTSLYNAYRRYWERLQAHNWQGWTTNAGRDHDGDPSGDGVVHTRVRVLPRISTQPGYDPYQDSLTQTASCRQLWFTTGSLDTARVTTNLKRLGDLQQAGCDVKALVQHDSHGCMDLERLIGSSNVREFYHGGAQNMHSKTWYLDGTYQGESHKIVWTGSHNLTLNSLSQHDESLLRIMDNAFVNQHYHDRFQTIWNAATRSWATAPKRLLGREQCGSPSRQELRRVLAHGI